jgi:hypothetical protein
MTPTPECDKITAARSESQQIGNFLEWLAEQNMEICTRRETGWGHVMMIPQMESREQLLARYFEVDLQEVERERRALLAEFSMKVE